jgi:hypothetical protein
VKEQPSIQAQEPNLFPVLESSFCCVEWFEMPMNNARAIRYRRLALATEDKANADLLLKLADECDRGLLCTAEWLSAAGLSRKNEQPKAGDARVRFEWDPYNDRH